MNGSRATEATTSATAPRRQKSRSRQVSCRVKRIAAETTKGTSERLNHEIVVMPDMKKATPNQTARRLLRSRANNTRASKRSGIQHAQRYGSCDIIPKRKGTNAKMIPATHAAPFDPVSVRARRNAP